MVLSTKYRCPHNWGDLNSTVNDLEDRQKTTGDGPTITPSKNSKVKTQTRNLLRDFTGHARLTDIWRQLHPTEREYTFYSHAHKSMSRIEYILLTETLITQVKRWG